MKRAPRAWGRIGAAAALAAGVAGFPSAALAGQRPPQVKTKCVPAELLSGGYCGDGGPAGQAGLAAPRDTAVLPNGDILIADGQNSAIRRAEKATNIISTAAGLGIVGDAPPAKPTPIDEVALSDPRGVAALPDGSFAIADAGLRAVLLVTPSGSVRTLLDAGDLRRPIDVAVDGTSLVVTDTAAGTLIKVDLQGNARVVARKLQRPWQVAVEAPGTFLVTQARPTLVTRRKTGKRVQLRRRGNVVRVAGGKSSVVAGAGAAGPAGRRRFDRISGVAVRADGRILVADRHAVRAVASTGEVTVIAGGNNYAANIYIGQGDGIADAGDAIVVADSGTNQVHVVPDDPEVQVSEIGIDPADPASNATQATLRMSLLVRLIAKKKSERKRTNQPAGEAPCVRRDPLQKTWKAKSFVDGKLVVPFNGEGTLQVKVARDASGTYKEIKRYRFKTKRMSGKPLKVKVPRKTPRQFFVRVRLRGGCNQTGSFQR